MGYFNGYGVGCLSGSESQQPISNYEKETPLSRHRDRMADETLGLINNNQQLVSAVQLAVNKIHQGGSGTEKVLVVSDGSDGPHIIAVNSDLVISEFCDDSCSSADPPENGLLAETNDADFEEPASKKVRYEEKEDNNETCKMLLMHIHKALYRRLKSIERKMRGVNQRCQNIEEKVELAFSQLHEAGIGRTIPTSKHRSGPVIVGLPQNSENGASRLPMPHVGPNVTLITLNSEEDYPEGSWLGEENNPECRVRCHILPSDMSNLNRACHSPEKMALTLLDYLFDRETQACSNISGLGKHGKKQLDPLMIYGIRCHLISKFGIEDRDWHRIKQNMDSKCRTAFRRKQKGMPLTVKAFRDRLPATYVQMLSNSSQNGSLVHDLTDGELTMDELDLHDAFKIKIPITMSSQPTVSITMEDIGEPQIIHTAQGDIQVVHATPEQIAQFQQSGHIQILAEEMPIIEAADCLKDDESP